MIQFCSLKWRESVCVCVCVTMSGGSHGYDIGSAVVLNKNGVTVDEQHLKRYKCVFCDLLLRDACQMACGDRSCRVCLPQEYVLSCLYLEQDNCHVCMCYMYTYVGGGRTSVTCVDYC